MNTGRDRRPSDFGREDCRAAGGFTLIEIMVALGILGTALFVLLGAHNSSLRLFSAADELVTNRVLLERALGEAETHVMAGTLAGEEGFGARFPDATYRWDATLVMGEDLPGFYEVRVVVVNGDGETEKSFLVYGLSQELEDAA